jgi:endonuclease/exonuclease/phosphatase family metal-dependent hydrolase
MNSKLLKQLSFKYHPLQIPNDSKSTTANSNNQLQSPKEDDLLESNVVPRKFIRLLTYNMFMRPPPVKTNATDFKDARLDEFVKQLDNFDIICFQEVFTTLNTRKQRLISYAQKAGLIHHAVCEAPSLFSGYATDGGLLIVSRFPIIESEFDPYPYGVVSDALSYKGVLYCKIMIQNKHVLHLFNTHTQASYFHDDLETFVRT